MNVPAKLRARGARGACGARGALATAALAVLGLLAPLAAHGQADALKISQLEQDLRDLRRTVEQQQRRLDVLERGDAPGLVRPPGSAPGPAVPGGPATAGSATAGAGRDAPWLQAGQWERVRSGLGEMDVIALLGPPTSMRAAADGRTRTLYYALEIGSAGYLAGHVVLEERRVVAVERPRLR